MSENIPSTWGKTSIGEVYEVIGGGTPSTKVKEYWNGSVPWITSADIHGVREISGSRFVSKKGIENSTTNKVPPKTLLVVTRVGLGKIAISEQDICFSQDLQGLVVSPELVWPEFALYFLSYELQKLKFEGRGTTISGLTKKQLKDTAFPLPPFDEQERIVSKLEELLSELDKGIESFKTAREQLTVYRQAVLKHAFEGKLTEEWRKKHADELEPAEILLEKIKAEREQRYRQQLDDWKRAVKAWEASGKEGKKPTKPGKPKELPPITKEELSELPELPDGWGWVRLSRISENVQIGPFGSLLHKADYISNGTPLVNPSHIKDQSIEPDWNFAVSEKKIKSLRKYVMNENDIVMGRRGEMGRCAVVSEKENGWLCGTGSLFVRLLPSAHSDFYCYVLSSRRTKDFLSGNSIGTTMQNLNQKILNNVPVPFCNLKEQNEVIQAIESRLSAAERLEQDIEGGLKQAEALRQSLLKKAFEGRLVPQDSNDEPASVLLERIKLDKAKLKQKARKEKKVAV